MCNCIHELLNVFEGSAQREHTIDVVTLDTAVVGVKEAFTYSNKTHR